MLCDVCKIIIRERLMFFKRMFIKDLIGSWVVYLCLDCALWYKKIERRNA